MMIKKSILLCALSVFFMLPTVSVEASAESENRMKLLRKLDMLDSLDFREFIDSANECTAQRRFKCSKRNIREAEELVRTRAEKKELSYARLNLGEEIEQVQLEEKAAERKRIARIEREEERAAERRRRKRIEREEEREREREEERRRDSQPAQENVLAGVMDSLNNISNSMPSASETFRQANIDARDAQRRIERDRERKAEARREDERHQRRAQARREDESREQAQLERQRKEQAQRVRKRRELAQLEREESSCEQRGGTYYASTRNCVVVKTMNTVIVKDLGYNRPYGSEISSSDVTTNSARKYNSSSNGASGSRNRNTSVANNTTNIARPGNNQQSNKCTSLSPVLSTHPLPVFSVVGKGHLGPDGALSKLVKKTNEIKERTCGNKHFNRVFEPARHRKVIEKKKRQGAAGLFDSDIVELTIKDGQTFSCLCTPQKSKRIQGKGVAR